MKNIFLAIPLLLMGCQSVNIGFRSNIHTTIQESSTDGKNDNNPKQGDERIDANKQTDFRPDVDVKSGEKEL